MKKIDIEFGSAYALNKPYWAGEHTFYHYSNMTENDRSVGDYLWSVDVYTRSGINPIQHNDRKYVWARNEKEAAENAESYFGDDKIILITLMKPLEDKLAEPAIF